MSDSLEVDEISHGRRLELLAGLHGFDQLPASAREELANVLHVEVFAPGSAIVEERELGDRLYIIVAGIAEVFTAGPTHRILLDELSTGKMFGEVALVSKIRRRKATVVSVTRLVTLSLSAVSFEKMLSAHPEVLNGFIANAEALMAEKLHKVTLQH